MRFSSVCCVVPAVVCCAASLHAQQGGVRLKTEVSQRTVEQGQAFQLQFTALVGSGQPAPSSPRLPAPPGATVHGPSLSSQQQVVMRGGGIEQSHGFTATWSITPARLGKLRVGPPSVVVGSQQHQGEAVVVEVVPAGQGPGAGATRPNRGFPNDPFDFFRGRGSLFPRGLFGDPFGDTLQDDAPFVPNYPAEYAVATSPPDSVAFLRSKLDQKSAVVGEQVTLGIYAYGNRGPFREANSNEPQAADFISFPIVENSGHERQYQVDIGDDVWHAVKVRELALFPLRAGNLPLGKMRMGFMGRGYALSTGQQGLMRESELLTIAVEEPPLAGRPAGYRIGDVGRYQLSAEVEPRTIRQGEAVSVAVTLTGTGNLPLKLPLPEREGTEWLQPQIRGEVAAQGSVVQGSRHFQYVVRLRKAGSIDLGEVRLPYWDPATNGYRTAEAKLGSVQVAPVDMPGRTPETEAEDGSLKLSRTLSPRDELGAGIQARTFLTEQAWFWAALGLGPMSLVLTGVSLRIASGVRRRLASRRRDARSLAASALGQAQKAVGRGDALSALGDAERALFLAVEAATGLKARAFLRQELAQKLIERDVPAETATKLTDALARSESARFTGATHTAAADEIVAQCAEVVSLLAPLRRPRKVTDSS